MTTSVAARIQQETSLTGLCTDSTLVYMKAVSFTEFRKNASSILSDVEKGETVEILRHGKIVAKIVPATDSKIPSWKTPKPRLYVKGLSLSKMIIEERRGSRS